MCQTLSNSIFLFCKFCHISKAALTFLYTSIVSQLDMDRESNTYLELAVKKIRDRTGDAIRATIHDPRPTRTLFRS